MKIPTIKSIKRRTSANRLSEEIIYSHVINEMSEGQFRDGLWAKALAHSGGSEEKARSLYIKYRVQSMYDEATVLDQIAENTSEPKSQGERHSNENHFGSELRRPITNNKNNDQFMKEIRNEKNKNLTRQEIERSSRKSKETQNLKINAATGWFLFILILAILIAISSEPGFK